MKVKECANHLATLIKNAGLPKLEDKVIALDLDDQLFTKLGSGLIKRPAVGILYEGGRTQNGQGGAQLGISAELTFSVLLLCEVPNIAPNLTETTTEAMVLLDGIRDAVQGQMSPTGHKWKWVIEAPAGKRDRFLVWLQRWAVPVQNTPSRFRQ